MEEILKGEYPEELFKGWYNGSKQYVSTTIVNGDLTLYAEYYTAEEIDTYRRRLFDNSNSDYVYIHYRRKDHVVSERLTRPSNDNCTTPINSETYKDWPLWAWPWQGEGRFFHAAGIDMFGAVYVIDTTRLYTDCGWDSIKREPLDEFMRYNTDLIGIQFVKYSSVFTSPSFWANDGGNIFLQFEYASIIYNHVFFLEDDTGNYAYYDAYAYIDSL